MASTWALQDLGRDGPCYPTENLGKGEWHYPNGHSYGEQGILGTVWQGWRLDTNQRLGTAGQLWALVPSFNTLLRSLAAGTAHFDHTPCPPQVQEQQREDNNASCPSVASSHSRGPRAGLPPSLPPRAVAGARGGRRAAQQAARPAPAGFPVATAPPERGPPLPICPALRTGGVCAGTVSAPHGDQAAPGRPAMRPCGQAGRGWGRGGIAAPGACAERAERRGHPSPPLRAAPAAPERGWACGVTATAPSRAPAQAARGRGAGGGRSAAGSAGEAAVGGERRRCPVGRGGERGPGCRGGGVGSGVSGTGGAAGRGRAGGGGGGGGGGSGDGSGALWGKGHEPETWRRRNWEPPPRPASGAGGHGGGVRERAGRWGAAAASRAEGSALPFAATSLPLVPGAEVGAEAESCNPAARGRDVGPGRVRGGAGDARLGPAAGGEGDGPRLPSSSLSAGSPSRSPT